MNIRVIKDGVSIGKIQFKNSPDGTCGIQHEHPTGEVQSGLEVSGQPNLGASKEPKYARADATTANGKKVTNERATIGNTKIEKITVVEETTTGNTTTKKTTIEEIISQG